MKNGVSFFVTIAGHFVLLTEIVAYWKIGAGRMVLLLAERSDGNIK